MTDPTPRPILLYGAGGHARVCLDLLLEEPWVEIAGVLSDDGRGRADLGHAAQDGPEELQRLAESGISATFCVGIGDNFARQRVSGILTQSGHHLTQAVSRAATVAASVKLGDGVQILPGAIVMAAAVLGDGVIVNTNASVDHDCVIGDFAHVAPGVALGGDVRIGARTLVGLGARVLPGVRVGADVVIGGGAVVIRDVPDGLTVVGNPARPLLAITPGER